MKPRNLLWAVLPLFALCVLPSCLVSAQDQLNATTPQPTYTIIAPSKIRPNSDYHVTLQITNTTSTADIEVEVSGQSEDGSLNRVSKSVSVNPSETQIVNLQIGEWSKPATNYNLTVKGKIGQFELKNETNLSFDQKSFSIFVQTDKAIYKPGQAVKFRVIVVNPSLIPSVNGTVDVFIKDAKENLIKQWKRVSPQRGIFSSELQLSEQPPLGDWSITVEVHGQKYTKTFSVAEYVLPTFSVDVLLPPYATYNRSNVVATVKAAYTYGKPVKGEMTLMVRPKARYSYRKLEQFQTKMKIDKEGSVDVPVNIVRDLNLKDFYQREIEFFAIVEEGLTGRKYNKSSIMKIYDKEVKVELIKTSNTFKPGLRYTAYLKVAYQDDKPVDDNGPPLKLKYGYDYNDANWTNIFELVPKKGLVRIDLYPPKSDDQVTIIGWRGEYRGQTYYLDSVECAESPSNSFIQVTSKTDQSLENLFEGKSAKVGDKVTFIVNATEPIKDIVYEVMAKGDIVLAQSIHSTDPSVNNFELTFPISHRMAPKARLLVYYVREANQEIVADALNFNVDGVFKTPVQLSSNVNQTKPGGQVDVRVETNPSAYVGFLGVDQSVLLLKSGNDITQDDVMQEMELYDNSKNSRPSWSSGWFFRHFILSGSSTAAEIFDDSGLVIFTNGIVYRKVHYVEYSYRRAGAIAFSSSGFSLQSAPGAPAPMATTEKAAMARPASASIPKSSKAIKLRQKFPETWIWSNVSAGEDGIARYSDKIPDTITSWYISAFAMDSTTGLGVADSSLKINVFRPFFIKLSLPYSIIRGESVSLQVLVFNYQNKPVQAEVIMENTKDEFEFTSAANEIDSAGQTEVRAKRKAVTVPSFDGVSVFFLVTPKKLGHIDIKVKATTDNAGDAIVRKLLVKPEGQTQYFNKAIFVKLDDQAANTIKKNFSIEVPANAVPGSVKVKVSGISDILGSTVNHIDDLLRMPYGCGEQNMINLVPNIVVLNYLTRVNRLTAAIKSKAIKHIESGYQRELTYRREDGSFSAFGKSDRAGSTWLTAFVVKSFLQAKHFIDVEPAISIQAIEWLFTRQQKDGSFAEYGEVHNKALQGGAALKMPKIGSSPGAPPDTSNDDSAGALTAYVLIAILHEDKSSSVRSKHEEDIKRAEEFIYNRLDDSLNSYEISIIAHALHLTDSDKKDYAYKKLMSLVKRDADGLVYWTGKPDAEPKTAEPNQTSAASKELLFVSDYLKMPDSLEVEATAYSLLTLVQRSDTDNGIPTLRWLISKQNSNGGFASTQDTVIGLQALGAIAQKITTPKLKMHVSVKAGESSDVQTFEFQPENALVLQQLDLSPETTWVELLATGFGTAIVQVSYQYNIAVSAEKPAFILNPRKGKSSTENYLELDICTSYTDGNSTNMAVMEIELPSGYNADVEALPEATRTKGVKRVDTANNDETVFVYLDTVTSDELCITVPSHRTYRVANNKPVPVTIYDYYDRSKLSRTFYEPTIVSVNDIAHDPTAPPSTVTSGKNATDVSSSVI